MCANENSVGLTPISFAVATYCKTILVNSSKQKNIEKFQVNYMPLPSIS